MVLTLFQQQNYKWTRDVRDEIALYADDAVTFYDYYYCYYYYYYYIISAAERRKVNVLEMKCLRSFLECREWIELGTKRCVGELEEKWS